MDKCPETRWEFIAFTRERCAGLGLIPSWRWEHCQRGRRHQRRTRYPRHSRARSVI